MIHLSTRLHPKDPNRIVVFDQKGYNQDTSLSPSRKVRQIFHEVVDLAFGVAINGSSSVQIGNVAVLHYGDGRASHDDHDIMRHIVFRSDHIGSNNNPYRHFERGSHINKNGEFLISKLQAMLKKCQASYQEIADIKEEEEAPQRERARVDDELKKAAGIAGSDDYLSRRGWGGTDENPRYSLTFNNLTSDDVKIIYRLKEMMDVPQIDDGVLEEA